MIPHSPLKINIFVNQPTACAQISLKKNLHSTRCAKKSHKDSIRIVITHEDCGNIEILNNLWYNAVNLINLNLTKECECIEKNNRIDFGTCLPLGVVWLQ